MEQVRKTDEELKSIAQSRWIFKANNTDEDLKKLAKDIYNGLVFTDRNCPNNNDIQSVFMVLMLMGPKSPTSPSEDKDTQGKRDNLIYDLIQREEDQKIYEYEEVFYKEYLGKVGMVYEYLDSKNMSPMSVNGLPCFFSCRFLSKEDTDKMLEFYKQYREIRETADNF